MPEALPQASILICDDQPINLRLAQVILSEQYRVFTATSGRQALALLRSEQIDLLLLDVMMPGMDGFDVAAEIRADPQLQQLPIIFLTAITDNNAQLQGLELGAIDFITKPVAPRILYHRVSKAIEREQLHQRLEREQRALQQANAELQQQKDALDAHCLVSITDAQGTITYANDRFCQVSGYPRDTLIGQNHRIIKSGIHPPAFYQDIWQTISSGQTWHGEIANRRSDGSLYWVDSTIVPWLDAHGRPYQYVAIRTDISARIHAEQQLAAARNRELAIGAQIQQRLLFGAPPQDLPGFAVACHSEASQGVDGDFYTFTRLGPDIFEVLTGDVMGKGVAAALIAAAIKNTYRRILAERPAWPDRRQLPRPAEVLNALHAAITPELIDLDSFATVALLRFNRAEQTVTWVNAGHTPTLLAHADGSISTLLGDNLPLGVQLAEHYVEHRSELATNDLILLYSDGISEARAPDGALYGLQPLQQLLHTARAQGYPPSLLLTALRSQLDLFTDYASGSDDRTLIGIQMRPLRGQVRGSIRDRKAPAYLDLPRQLANLTPLRQQIEQLAADQSEEDRQSLVLAVFEAATNIIRHSPETLLSAPITVRLERRPDALCVELCYAGTPYIPSDAHEPDFSGNSDGGFGLYIIEQSVDHVRYYAPLPGLAAIRLEKQIPASTP